MPTVMVLGAGMVGVATALQLQKRGWSVLLVDQHQPGRETSYGNAGIIQTEAVEPYALPMEAGRLLRMALGLSNDVHYHWRGLWQQGLALAQYVRYSVPVRHEQVSRAYSQIARRASQDHEEFIRAAQAEPLVRREGFRMMHRTEKGFDRLVEQAHRFHTRYGVPVRILSAADLRAAEPSLRDGGTGGVHWLDSWTCSDPCGLVGAYARLFVERGGTFVQADARSLNGRRNGGWCIQTDAGRLDAEHLVVALGPWSARFFQRFGLRFPMFYKRGYHRHYQGPQLHLPLMDVDGGYVMAPMRLGLRITTGAEIAAWGARPSPAQLFRAEQHARELLDLGPPREARPWSGLRPCMPDMLPVVGKVPGLTNVWAHFGHGHQGFTQGPTTGLLLAQLMSGEPPVLDTAPLSPQRFLR